MGTFFAPEERREQQIDDVQRAFPAAASVSSDRSVVDLPVDVAGGKSTALRITLTPAFPKERPVLSLLLPVHHPAVDSAGRLHCRALDNWSSTSSSLVDIVTEAVGLLVSVPPQAAGAPSRPEFMNNCQRREDQQAMALLCDVGSSVPLTGDPAVDVQQLSVSQLEELLRSSDAFKAFCAKWLPYLPAAQALEDMRCRCVTLARGNLELQAAIDEARNHVAIVRSSDYASARSIFDELCTRQQAVTAKLAPSVLKQRLTAQASKLDAESDELEDSFCSGATSVEAFVEQYRVARTNFHALDVKRLAAEQTMR